MSKWKRGPNPVPLPTEMPPLRCKAWVDGEGCNRPARKGWVVCGVHREEEFRVPAWVLEATANELMKEDW